MKASRTSSECNGISSPLTWINLRESDQHSFNVDYLSLIDGRFIKKTLYDLIDEWKLGDVPIQELSLRISQESGIPKELAKAIENESLGHQDWVACFNEYTLRSEDEKSKFVIAVRKHHQERGLAKLNFQYAVLDLTYILPCQYWKEIVRSKQSRIRKTQFDRWVVKFHDDTFGRTLQRSVMKHFWPTGENMICETRTYQRIKDNVWRIMSLGNGQD